MLRGAILLVSQGSEKADLLAAKEAKSSHPIAVPNFTKYHPGFSHPKGRIARGVLPCSGTSQVYHRGDPLTCDAMNPDDPSPEPVRVPIEDVLDLHTVSPRDVKAVVEEYLTEANRLGLKALRIIHGRGIGVQREVVRSVLAATPFVLSYADAPAEAGGWGATIVTWA